MSGLAQLIKERSADLALSQGQLAERMGVSQAAISKIVNNPTVEPGMSTLAGFAVALEVPLRRVLEACGYELDRVGPVDIDDRILAITRAVPEMRDLFFQFATELTPDDREALLAHMESIQRRREQKKP